MARQLHKLKEVTARAAKKPGRLSDGGGLYLNVSKTGSKSWVFIWKRTPPGATKAKHFEAGLGSYPAVTLARARERARECREAVAEGRNPIDERRKEAEPTFAECAEQFLATNETSWRNEKHRAQWRSSLETYAAPISAMKVSAIETGDVLRVLNPIWQSKHETASRVRGRIERVLDYAKAHGWRQGENPALWRGHLKNVLPARQKLSRGHHAAMAYKDVPAFMADLQQRDAMAALALRFLILTATRTGETINATWAEIDTDAAVWTIPASRMKAGKEHRIPLSVSALAILQGIREAGTGDGTQQGPAYVFPGQRRGRPMSNMAFAKLLERMNVEGVTPHGFRSAFRDWAGDETSFPRELAEHALAHNVGDETERAYRRADALDRRRKLMDAWASHCQSRPGATVVQFRRETE